MHKPNETLSLLPKTYRSPWIWILALAIPELLLLFIDVYSISIIWDDLKPKQTNIAWRYFTFLTVLILGSLITGLLGVFSKKNISLWIHTIFLLIQVVFLWNFMSTSSSLVNGTIPEWIFSSSDFIYYQFLLILPGAFFNLLHISTSYCRFDKNSNYAYSLGITVTIPIALYLLGMILSRISIFFGHFRIFDTFNSNIISFFMILLLIATLIIFLGMALRTVTLVFKKYQKKESKDVGFTLIIVVSWVLPFIGLFMNASVPFPTSFQSPIIAFFTFINGLFLLLRYKKGHASGHFLWVCRCMSYLYSVYFFIVFLPLIPLSIPLMLAFGSGFLLIAPSLLFLLHTKILIETCRHQMEVIGKLKMIVGVVFSLLTVPFIYTTTALIEKNTLEEATQYAFQPDYKSENKFQGNLSVLKHSFKKLIRFKEKMQMPFIDPYYNWLVFNSMVLPDNKINDMSLFYFGQTIDELKSQPLFNWGASRRTRFRGGRWTSPSSKDVVLKKYGLDQKQFEGTTTSTLHLYMENKSQNSFSQYQENIMIPKGVIVTGYWLKVFDEWVPGRVFEKKTALWVYNQITRRRKDPGLLIYEKNNQLNLRVYPLGIGEIRECKIEFTFPQNMQTHVMLGSKKVTLSLKNDGRKRPIQYQSNNGANWISLPHSTLPEEAFFIRDHYYHFILDCSLSAKNKWGKTKEKIKGFLNRPHTKDKKFKLTMANFESWNFNDRLISRNEFLRCLEELDKKRIQFRGGFFPKRIMKSEIVKYHQQENSITKLSKAPIFVIIGENEKSNQKSQFDKKFDYFSSTIPDVSHYIQSSINSNTFNVISTVDGDIKSLSFEGTLVSKVCILRDGSEFKVISQNKEIDHSVVDLPLDFQSLEFYNSDSKTFWSIQLNNLVYFSSRYAKGLDLLKWSKENILDPTKINDKIRSIVEQSQSLSILNPFTSFMVVETKSQWNILKRKEKQALNSNQVLEFDEVQESPSPGFFVMLLFLIGIIRAQKKKPRKKFNLVVSPA